MSNHWDDAEIIFGDEYDKLAHGCCVYGWFRDGECLYVGMSGTGLARILTHNKINLEEKVLPTDQIKLIWLNDYEEGMTLESILIEHHDPRYNGNAGYRPVISKRPLETRICVCCGGTFKQKRWYQKRCRQTCIDSPKPIPPKLNFDEVVQLITPLPGVVPEQQTKT